MFLKSHGNCKTKGTWLYSEDNYHKLLRMVWLNFAPVPLGCFFFLRQNFWLICKTRPTSQSRKGRKFWIWYCLIPSQIVSSAGSCFRHQSLIYVTEQQTMMKDFTSCLKYFVFLAIHSHSSCFKQARFLSMSICSSCIQLWYIKKHYFEKVSAQTRNSQLQLTAKQLSWDRMPLTDCSKKIIILRLSYNFSQILNHLLFWSYW